MFSTNVKPCFLCFKHILTDTKLVTLIALIITSNLLRVSLLQCKACLYWTPQLP